MKSFESRSLKSDPRIVNLLSFSSTLVCLPLKIIAPGVGSGMTVEHGSVVVLVDVFRYDVFVGDEDEVFYFVC